LISRRAASEQSNQDRPLGFDSGVIDGAVDALAKAFGTDAAGTGSL
jgi:hypothetical protein